jgi:hypothetical protein
MALETEVPPVPQTKPGASGILDHCADDAGKRREFFLPPMIICTNAKPLP